MESITNELIKLFVFGNMSKEFRKIRDLKLVCKDST